MSVFKICSESLRRPLVTSSKTRQSKGVRRNRREVKCDIRNSIRRKFRELYFRNPPPTLNRIMTISNKDSDLPSFKKPTLHVLLRETKYVCVKKGNKAIML
jgi:hypothetical protein